MSEPKEPTQIQIQTTPHGFPRVEVGGGPSPANLSLKIDGVEVRKVSHLEVVVDVNKAVQVRTWQFAEVVVDVEAEVTDEGWIIGVDTLERGDGDEGDFVRNQTRVAEGHGATLREALLDAVANLPVEP